MRNQSNYSRPTISSSLTIGGDENLMYKNTIILNKRTDKAPKLVNKLITLNSYCSSAAVIVPIVFLMHHFPLATLQRDAQMYEEHRLTVGWLSLYQLCSRKLSTEYLLCSAVIKQLKMNFKVFEIISIEKRNRSFQEQG